MSLHSLYLANDKNLMYTIYLCTETAGARYFYKNSLAYFKCCLCGKGEKLKKSTANDESSLLLCAQHNNLQNMSILTSP